MFDYSKAKLEDVTCNLCGSMKVHVLARRSKTGLRVRTLMCRKCGLIFISPRMSKADYDLYYKNVYRQDRNVAKGVFTETDLDRNFKYGRRFGLALAEKYKNFLKPGLTLDVGSSTGGILAGLKEAEPALKIQGIEPSLSESEYANAHGVPTERALFEDYKDNLGSVQNIFCVQSLNHLLDPKSFLERSRDMLAENGHLFLAVKNFRHQIRRAGNISAGVQIDHPYMFTPESLKLLVRRAGFYTLDFDVDEYKTIEEIAEQKKKGFNIHHIRLVAKKSKPDLNLPSKSELQKLRRHFNPFFIKLFYLFHHSKYFKVIRK